MEKYNGHQEEHATVGMEPTQASNAHIIYSKHTLPKMSPRSNSYKMLPVCDIALALPLMMWHNAFCVSPICKMTLPLKEKCEIRVQRLHAWNRTRDRDRVYPLSLAHAPMHTRTHTEFPSRACQSSRPFHIIEHQTSIPCEYIEQSICGACHSYRPRRKGMVRAIERVGLGSSRLTFGKLRQSLPDITLT